MSSSDATAYDAGRAPTSTAADLPTGTVHDEPTQSHALAVADHNEKGLAQEDHDEPEMRDVGWHEEAHHVSQPLVAGLTNEELWMYTRRFNKVPCPRFAGKTGVVRWFEGLTMPPSSANLPRQRDCSCASRWPRSRHLEGRGVLAGQIAREPREVLHVCRRYRSFSAVRWRYLIAA